MPDDFACYLVTKDDRGVQAQVTRQPLANLPQADVLVRVHWSSLNYKDALSATGNPGVTRKFPHVPGIDAAGVVEESGDPNWKPGDQVLVTGYDQGQNTWGGFAEYVRVPTTWIVPKPQGLSLRECMIYGTAGLTAGLCVEAIVEHRLPPWQGEVVVTGASGGVGSVAVALLAHLGYQAVASTGKPESHDLLRELGATRICDRQEVCDTSSKPMLPVRWAGAVDTVGGQTLTSIIRAAQRGACITACGLVGGADLPLTVYPFILRGVALVGIDSAECPSAQRQRIWNWLAGDWKLKQLESLVTEIRLADLATYVPRILAGQVTGRAVVRLKD